MSTGETLALVVNFIIIVLAVYRVSNMIAFEDGPFDVFSWWRGVVGQKNWIGRGFHCILCVSFWLSALGAVWLAYDLVSFFVYWLSVAGGVLVVRQYLTKG